MRVAQEKTKFLEEMIEFLGSILTSNGTKTDPEKIKTIKEYTEPKNLFSLWSLLRLVSYYKSFVKDFVPTYLHT